ncbi:MAG: WD40 repeat domain-containing serine/threonine protein kinase [Planctomycetota bacterium]
MSDESSPGDDRDLDGLPDALEDLLARRRRGETISFSEVLAAHPGQESTARDLVEMLDLLESVGEEHRRAQGIEFDSGLDSENEGGRTLGDYRIVREVGRGGMGVVYEAEELSLLRRVALKVLPIDATGDKRRVQRFEREVRAVARLHHEHIVPIYGVGSEDDAHFYTMPLVQGEGLDTILEELRRLRDEDAADDSTSSSSASRLREKTSESFRNVARIASEVADALDYAHGEGILHRDVKPSNILIDRDDKTWLTDFGLAKDTSSDTFTRSGDIVGTLAYMSPEATRGWSDPRSDVYSLGLTLYELATLEPAFRSADGTVLLERVLSDDPPAPRKVDPSIPRDLETIILRSIDKDPHRRYQGARELREDLEAFREGRPIQARRAGSVERTWRFAKRNRALSAITLVALLLVAAVSTSLWINQRLDLAEKEGRFWRNVSDSNALASGDRIGHRPDGLALVDSARELLDSLNLDSVERSNRILSLRELAIRHEVGLDVMKEAASRNARFETAGFRSFDPALESGIAVKGRDLALRRLSDLEELTPIRRPLDPRFRWPVHTPVYSAGGRYLALRYVRNSLAVFDLKESGRVVCKTSTASMRSASQDFSRSEKLFAYLSPKTSRVSLVELPSGKTRVERRFEVEVRGLSIAPIDDLVAVGLRRRVLFLSAEDLSEQGSSLFVGETINGLAWSPDAQALAVASEKRCQVFGIEDDASRFVLREPGVRFIGAEFSPDGDLLLTRSSDGVARIWNARTGRRLLSLRGHVSDNQMTFARGGTLLAERLMFRDPIRPMAPQPDVREEVARSPSLFRIARNSRLRRNVPAGNVASLAWGEQEAELLSVRSGRLVRFWLDARRESQILSKVDSTGSLYECRVIREDGRTPQLALIGEKGVGVTECPKEDQASIAAIDWIDPGEFVDVSVSPGGRYLMALKRTGQRRPPVAKLWDLQNRNLLHECSGPPGAKFAVVRPDASSFLVADTATILRVTQDEGGFSEPETLHDVRLIGIEALRLSADAKSLFVVTRDERVQVDCESWQIVGRRHRGFFNENRTGVGRRSRIEYPISATLDGSLLATVEGRLNQVRLERFPSGELLARLDLSISDPVEEISLSPDGRFLVARAYPQGLETWDLTELRRLLAVRRLDW